MSNKCNKCGSNINVEIHHIDKDTTNNSPNNLILLCRKCHRRLHKDMRPKMITTTIRITSTQKQWIDDNYIKLSLYIQKKINEDMKK